MAKNSNIIKRIMQNDENYIYFQYMNLFLKGSLIYLPLALNSFKASEWTGLHVFALHMVFLPNQLFQSNLVRALASNVNISAVKSIFAVLYLITSVCVSAYIVYLEVIANISTELIILICLAAFLPILNVITRRDARLLVEQATLSVVLLFSMTIFSIFVIYNTKISTELMWITILAILALSNFIAAIAKFKSGIKPDARLERYITFSFHEFSLYLFGAISIQGAMALLAYWIKSSSIFSGRLPFEYTLSLQLSSAAYLVISSQLPKIYSKRSITDFRQSLLLSYRKSFILYIVATGIAFYFLSALSKSIDAPLFLFFLTFFMILRAQNAQLLHFREILPGINFTYGTIFLVTTLLIFYLFALMDFEFNLIIFCLLIFTYPFSVQMKIVSHGEVSLKRDRLEQALFFSSILYLFLGAYVYA